jgi:DNA-binding transcriptional MerR regulator
MKRTKEEIQEANLALELMFPNLSTDLQYRFRNAIQTIGFAIDEIEEIKEEPMKQEVTDQIVLSVMAKYAERSETGLKKYGTPLTRNDLTLDQWITHLQEELMDATLYLERIKKDIALLEVEAFSNGYREAINTEQNKQG